MHAEPNFVLNFAPCQPPRVATGGPNSPSAKRDRPTSPDEEDADRPHVPDHPTGLGYRSDVSKPRCGSLRSRDRSLYPPSGSTQAFLDPFPRALTRNEAAGLWPTRSATRVATTLTADPPAQVWSRTRRRPRRTTSWRTFLHYPSRWATRRCPSIDSRRNCPARSRCACARG